MWGWLQHIGHVHMSVTHTAFPPSCMWHSNVVIWYRRQSAPMRQGARGEAATGALEALWDEIDIPCQHVNIASFDGSYDWFYLKVYVMGMTHRPHFQSRGLSAVGPNKTKIRQRSELQDSRNSVLVSNLQPTSGIIDCIMNNI